MNEDLLAPLINQAHDAGWQLVPQIGSGPCHNALVFLGDGFCDVVTVPLTGTSLVVRLEGDPELGHPRRQRGRERWRHVVPIRLALAWVLSGPNSDEMLIDPLGEVR